MEREHCKGSTGTRGLRAHPSHCPHPRHRTFTHRRTGSSAGSGERRELWGRDALLAEAGERSGGNGAGTGRSSEPGDGRLFPQLKRLQLLVNPSEAATGYHSDRVPGGGATLPTGVSASTPRLETWSRRSNNFRRKKKPVPSLGRPLAGSPSQCLYEVW